ncbi:MAG: vWA domain-containing protein [Thermoprotei archaeon]
MSAPLSVSVLVNRQLLPANIDVPIYVLMKVFPTREAADFLKQNPRKVSVIFTLDISSSMSGDKLEIAKQAIIRRFERDFELDDNISVVTFGDKAEVLVKPTKKEKAGNFRQIIQPIDTGDGIRGTNLYEGLQKSVDLLSSAPQGYLRRIILTTDGMPTAGVTDADAIVGLAKKAAESGVRVDVYGIGDDYDYGLCKAIADASGGWMRHALAASDLEALSRTSVDGYKSTIIDKLMISMRPVANVELENAVQVYPQVKDLDRETSYDVGSLTTSPIFVAARLKVHKGMEPGVHKILDIGFNALNKEVSVNIVSDESWVPEDCAPRMYYLYANKVVEMQERVTKVEGTQDVEAALHELLSTQCSQQLRTQDPYFQKITQVSGEAKTIVDQRTKLDKYSAMG